MRHMRDTKEESRAMKMGEYQEWMANLATISGCSAEMLEKTPARVLFALNVAIEERDRAKEALTAYQPIDPIEEGIRRSQRGKE
jgi:hypothetical protein